MKYADFLASKSVVERSTGMEVPKEKLHEKLYDFQRDITHWALLRGKAAIFADCGLGKTLMQLVWASHVSDKGRVLIVAPLAVAAQTVEEGRKFGIHVEYAKTEAESNAQIVITNYERLSGFTGAPFVGVVLDESSILKSYTGMIRNQIIEMFARTPFKLACTATPAPNDFMELGNHAEFLGIMTRTEMLAMFFIHDGGETQKWRLKGHSNKVFWEWVCSWAVMIRKPSDLGYEDGAFELPKLNIIEHVVKTERKAKEGFFATEAMTLQERQQERKATIQQRAEEVAMLAKADDQPWLIWCNLNSESETVRKMIPGAVEVSGSHSVDSKTENMLGFSHEDIRVLVTKPSIAGFGMNWQHCNNVAFLGLSDSYEEFYQAIRRCWRFGQTREVNCHIVTASTEGAVVKNIKRKEADAQRMAMEMVRNMHVYNEKNIKGATRAVATHKRDLKKGKAYKLHLADCVDAVAEIKTGQIDYTIFSPPFASLYTYSNSDRDMGNSKDGEEFAKHFGFLVGDLFRVTRPGRLLSFHCMNLPTSKVKDGYIGIRDFRGELIRMFEEAGFIFHSEVCIWKDPVTAMQRTKALGLLHKQMVKDSCMSRQGIPDYLVTMRKPGENTKPVTGELDTFVGDSSFRNSGNLSIDIWQRYASPVWMDINPSRTLQYQTARENDDERHICPLQLDVIERAMQLWTIPNDVVLSPFAGIGSEGYVAVKMGRRFIGVELKESYWKLACRNLEQGYKEAQTSIFK